jgi:hypothetical protein
VVSSVTQPGLLAGFLRELLGNMPSQAGSGEAQIRATLTAKSRRGQVRKHYIWYGLVIDRARLHTQCSTCRQIQWESDEGGENRESQISLTQGANQGNCGNAGKRPVRQANWPCSGKQVREIFLDCDAALLIARGGAPSRTVVGRVVGQLKAQRVLLIVNAFGGDCLRKGLLVSGNVCSAILIVAPSPDAQVRCAAVLKIQFRHVTAITKGRVSELSRVVWGSVGRAHGSLSDQSESNTEDCGHQVRKNSGHFRLLRFLGRRSRPSGARRVRTCDLVFNRDRRRGFAKDYEARKSCRALLGLDRRGRLSPHGS